MEYEDEDEALMDLCTATVDPPPTFNVQVLEKEKVAPIDTVNHEKQEERQEEVNSRV